MSEKQSYWRLHKKCYLLFFLSESPHTDCVSNGTIVCVPVTHFLQLMMCKHIPPLQCLNSKEYFWRLFKKYNWSLQRSVAICLAITVPEGHSQHYPEAFSSTLQLLTSHHGKIGYYLDCDTKTEKSNKGQVTNLLRTAGLTGFNVKLCWKKKLFVAVNNILIYFFKIKSILKRINHLCNLDEVTVILRKDRTPGCLKTIEPVGSSSSFLSWESW